MSTCPTHRESFFESKHLSQSNTCMLNLILHIIVTFHQVNNTFGKDAHHVIKEVVGALTVQLYDTDISTDIKTAAWYQKWAESSTLAPNVFGAWIYLKLILEMQHVFISIKLGSELRSEEVREDVESRRKQMYRELNMDWLAQNVGGKKKNIPRISERCPSPFLWSKPPPQKHKEHKLRPELFWRRYLSKHQTPSCYIKIAKWHKLRAGTWETRLGNLAKTPHPWIWIQIYSCAAEHFPTSLLFDDNVLIQNAHACP